MNKTRREVWREQVWLYLQDQLLYVYCGRETFQWLLDLMYFQDTSAKDAVLMITKVFCEPQLHRESGMQLLYDWRVEADDPLDKMEGSGHEDD